MTKEEFEKELTARIEDIRALYKRYNPEAYAAGNEEYLAIGLVNGTIQANNRHYKIGCPDNLFPVDLFVGKEA